MKENFALLITALSFLSILAISCGGQKGVMSKNQKHSLTSNENWQIEHRIPDCDSSLVFMDNLIVPITSKLPLKERGFDRGTIQIYIPGESNDFYKNEKYKFYVNPKCIEGLGVNRIFKIFCTEESYQEFIAIDNEYRKDDSEWGLEISSKNGFGMGIKIRDGIVKKVFIGGTTIESK